MSGNIIILKEFGEMLALSTSYIQLAQVYDRLMADTPYDLWIQYAEAEWDYFQLAPKKVMDLACGTGNISILLAKRGYHVIGIDLSEEMLAITQDKAQQEGLSLNLYHQDMRELVSSELMDSIVCFCDSLNYVTDPRGIYQTFEQVYRYLRPGGVFLFDVHSVYKIREVFGDRSFNWTEEDIAYLWDCEYEGEDQVSHFLTFFIKEGELYRKFEEVHVQRGYSMSQLMSWLEKVGFIDIRCSGDFHHSSPSATSERLFFSCKKPK